MRASSSWHRWGVVLFLVTAAGCQGRCPAVIRQGVLHTTTNAIGPPELAVGNGVFVAWTEGANVRVSKANEVSSPAFNPAITVDTTASSSQLSIKTAGSHVYLAWMSQNGHVVSFTVSNDAGGSFSPPTPLATVNPAVMGAPQVAAYANTVVVSWLELIPGSLGTAMLKVRSSADAGASFAPEQTLSAVATYPYAIVNVAGGVHVVWCEGGNIAFNRSTNGGVSFGAPMTLSSLARCREPQIQADGTDVHVVWAGATTGVSHDIFSRSSADNGVTFGAGANVSQTAANSDQPSLSVEGQRVYIAWRDTGGDAAGDEDILFAKSDDRGVSFSSWQNLSPGAFDQESSGPVVKAAGPNVHVAWYDLGVGNYDIYHRMSSDNGQTFLTASQVPPGPSNPFNETSPRMYVYGASRPNRLIVWSRSDTHTFEIAFYSWFRKP